MVRHVKKLSLGRAYPFFYSFPRKFREFWKSEGVRCIWIPTRAPKANAFAETWIESFKREYLNHFVCVNPEQLDYIASTWVR